MENLTPTTKTVSEEIGNAEIVDTEMEETKNLISYIETNESEISQRSNILHNTYLEIARERLEKTENPKVKEKLEQIIEKYTQKN